MLVDRRTWTTMFYFLLMLPLGILYFVIADGRDLREHRPDRRRRSWAAAGTGVGGGGITLDDTRSTTARRRCAAPFLLVARRRAADGGHAPGPRHRPRARHAREEPAGRAHRRGVRPIMAA